MDWGARLDRRTLPLKRFVAEFLAPNPDKLGYPLFSARIADRIRRWKIEKQPNPYSAIGSKLGGQTFMRSLGYAVPEVYGIYPALDAIPSFDDLPKNFVLKPVNGWKSAGVFLMRDGVDWFSKRHLTRDDVIRAAMQMTRRQNPGANQQWIAEELLVNFDGRGQPAHDYKFFCFGPKVVAFRVVNHTSRSRENQSWTLDPDWRPLPFRLRWDWYTDRSTPTKPPFFDEMLDIVSKVGEKLNIFLRIDMYATDRGPVFGEFTAYPSLGLNYTPRADAWLGAHWKTLDGGIDLPADP